MSSNTIKAMARETIRLVPSVIINCRSKESELSLLIYSTASCKLSTLRFPAW